MVKDMNDIPENIPETPEDQTAEAHSAPEATETDPGLLQSPSRFRRFMDTLKSSAPANLSRLAFCLCVPVCYFMVEVLNENNPFTDLELWQIAWNGVWYIVLLALSWVIFRKRRRAAAITAVCCFIFGLANHYVLRFRGKTLFPSDITSWRTAANVAGTYDYSMDRYMWIALAILAGYIIILALCRPEKGRKKFSLKLGLPVAGVLAAFFVAFFLTNMLPYFHIYAQQWNTRNNGFMLNFMVSLRYSIVTEPDGYSRREVEQMQEETMSRLEEDIQSGEDEAPEGQQPINLIVIMNESFADLSIYEKFGQYEVTRDPLQFYHIMEENTIKGWMCSPVEGGGTATVEFEYLTGDSASFLPDGTVAYQIYIDSYTPTMVDAMDRLGYDSWAFHPYKSSGWNRPVVYDLFGFAHQLYDEDVENPQYVRSYISDSCDYETLYGITDAANGEKTFIFNVTMQNHSSYGQNWKNLRNTVQAKGAIKDADSHTNQYLSLIDASDAAIEELITHYSQVEEPTMIVFFGDHQPYLSDELFEALYGKPLSERTGEEVMTQYMTPFFIWANYDIPEQKDVCISASFLSVLTMQTANLPLTGYMELLSEVMEELPVVHRLGFYTADGSYVSSREELTESQRALLEKYEYNAYYHLFDRNEESDAFYRLPEDIAG